MCVILSKKRMEHNEDIKEISCESLNFNLIKKILISII